MEDKKVVKVSAGTAVCIFIIILLVIALGIVYYLGFVNNKGTENIALKTSEKIEETATKTEEKTMQNTVADKQSSANSEKQATNNSTEEVPMSERVAFLNYGSQSSERFYSLFMYIDNGNLYYLKENKDLNPSFVFLSTGGEAQKYTQKSGFKRISQYNAGTGVNPKFFLITESGEVYTTNELVDNELSIELYEPLKDYKIEKILDCSDEITLKCKVLLKDGTTTTIEK